MNRMMLIVVAAALAACTSPEDLEVRPTVPAWTEWPAQVRAGQPFDVRLVGYAPGCFPRQELRVAVQRVGADIVIRTVWLVEGSSDPACDPGYFDTLVTVAGLPATIDSSYSIVTSPGDQGPFLTRGTVLVRATAALSDQTRGAGSVVGGTDVEGCAVMQRPFDPPIPVENPPGATWMGFVRGYFFTPGAPLCGQTRAFHVEGVS
jgi:hypothetical protein